MAPPLSQFDAPMVLLLSQPLTSQGLELKLEALEELVLLLRLMARADFESSLGFFRTKFLFWGLLTPSFRTRARPAFSSSVFSFRTDPVAKGVWGTVVHCWKVEVLQKKKARSELLTEIHLVSITWSMVRRSWGFVLRQPLIRSFASSDTSDHSGLGKSNWPKRIRFFMPGDNGRPWVEKNGGNPQSLLRRAFFRFGQDCKYLLTNYLQNVDDDSKGPDVAG